MGEAAEKMKLLIAILFVCRLFTFQASRTDTVHVWKTYLPGRDWEIKMSPVLSSSLNCQIPSNELRAHRRHPAPPHPACFSASLSPPTIPAPTSGLHFPFSPRLQDVCVLAHLSERRPCGCWWLTLGLTPVTALHNAPPTHLPTYTRFSVLRGVLLTRHWCHLCTKRLNIWWLLCYGYMHSDNTFKHTHSPNTWTNTCTQADGPRWWWETNRNFKSNALWVFSSSYLVVFSCYIF